MPNSLTKPNTALCPEGLIGLFDDLVTELSENNLLPTFDPKQQEDLIKCTINGIKNTCGGEDINDDRKALNLEVRDVNDENEVHNLMNAFRAVLIAEYALNPELNKNLNPELKNVVEQIKNNPELGILLQHGLDNPAIKLLIGQKSENGEKDENKAEKKEALKLLLIPLLAAAAAANNQKLDPQELEKKADNLADELISPKMKPGQGSQEKEEMLAKDKQEDESQKQQGITLSKVLGVNPFTGMTAGGPADGPIESSLSGMGIADINVGGGDATNFAAKQNTEDFGADPSQTKAATLINAVSAGIPIDTSAEINAMTDALRPTIQSIKNTK